MVENDSFQTTVHASDQDKTTHNDFSTEIEQHCEDEGRFMDHQIFGDESILSHRNELFSTKLCSVSVNILNALF